eukprot:182346-Prorocentrum_minimum.AAC.1
MLELAAASSASAWGAERGGDAGASSERERVPVVKAAAEGAAGDGASSSGAAASDVSGDASCSSEATTPWRISSSGTSLNGGVCISTCQSFATTSPAGGSLRGVGGAAAATVCGASACALSSLRGASVVIPSANCSWYTFFFAFSCVASLLTSHIASACPASPRFPPSIASALVYSSSCK